MGEQTVKNRDVVVVHEILSRGWELVSGVSMGTGKTKAGPCCIAAGWAGLCRYLKHRIEGVF